MRSFTKLRDIGLTLFLTAYLSACSPMATSFKNAQELNNKDNVIVPEDKAKQLQCLDSQPDYILGTDILYFQMTDSYGAKVGVNFLQGLLRAIGFGIDYAKGELSTAMHLIQPLNTSIPVSDRPGVATAKKIKFDVNFGIYIVDLGFSYYTTTSLAALSDSAMRNNLSNIVADIHDDWTTHVSHVYNAAEIEIPVGYKAGIKAGDEFAIYNVEWEFTGGAPCQGSLKIARRLSQTPIATAIVSQNPSASTSILVIKPLNFEIPVSMYNLVTVASLVPNAQTQGQRQAPPRNPLKHSVRVGPVTGKPILFDTGSGNVKIDITPFAAQQLTTIVNDPNSVYGMYLMQ